MSENDTLIILSGTYSGDSNVMSAYGNRPPNGTGRATDPNGGYTVIRAETEGTVIFDGQNSRMMFKFNGSGPFQYLTFRGLKWINSSGLGIQAYNFDHVKFIRCGAHTDASGNTSSFNISSSRYVLAEECYAWGGGRYKFIAYLSDHIIFRRCVGRLDAVRTTMPIATFQNYCSQHIEFQNCIAIDNDSSAYWSGYSYLEGGFTMHDTHNNEDSEYAAYSGCIVLNHDSYGFIHSDDGVNDITYSNCVAWDLGDSGMAGNCGTSISVEHMTWGNIADDGVDVWPAGGNYGVSNSIIYGTSDNGLKDVATSDYNCVYQNTVDYNGVAPGAHDFSTEGGRSAVDPLGPSPGNGTSALKYLVRIEDGADLDGAASDGGDIGATIVTKIGVSGTLYGEHGYQADTGESLWPFPYEDQMRADMRTYNPGGTNPAQPDGERGFCADGQTLTKYIWEYLGHPIPPEIYGDSIPNAPSGLEIAP